ncbi:CHASE3 domain-containing protein [Phenylobacterium sp.]|jgi:PAS domain S-box-containing protein|uniref:CHASE3 domain-containing protein n=1 Tax=Phenylobacterium sp. TaxID=1871053 RepID=UPI0037844963
MSVQGASGGTTGPIKLEHAPPRSVKAARFIALVLAPLLALGVAISMFVSLGRVEAQRHELQRSYETRWQIQHVFSLLQDAETGQRGHALTGKPAFLEPYLDAMSALDEQLRVLDRLFADEPDQQRRMVVLRRQVAAKVAIMERGIGIRRDEGLAPVVDYVSTEQGKRAMDAIRATVSEMVARESRSLNARLRAADRQARRAELVAGLMGLILLVSLTGAVILIRRHSRARQVLIEELQDRAIRQEAGFESTLTAVMVFNPSGTIEQMNRAAEKLFGYDREELVRRDVSVIMDLAPGEGLFLDRVGVGREAGEGVIREIDGRRKDGLSIPLEVLLAPMPLRDGVHVTASVRDLRERREAERLKDEFVSTVSHELRTPLTSIAGSLSLMDAGVAGPLPEKAARLTHIAKTSCERLVRLINDLLDMQKIAAGKIQLQDGPLDLRDVIAAAAEAISGMASERRVPVQIAAPADPVVVRGDADRLVQVLVNLLSNAMKFSPAGESVDLTLATEGERAVVRVRDRGPGVPESFQASLFSRFAQADGSAGRAVGGSGLGLAISREIVERHHGVIRLVESSGQGALFAVELPLAPAFQDPPEAQVLICERDPEVAAAMCEALVSEGFSCVQVSGVGEAEAAVRRRRYGVLLLGLRHDDGDGLTLAHRLGSDPTLAPPPVILVGGETPEAAGSFPIADWITAPLNPLALRAAVRAAITTPGGGARILHVDDDAELTAVVAAALEGFGTVEAVATLAQAQAAVRRRRPDLVILDIGLPDGSGLELLTALGPPGEAPPVIVYSGQEIDAGTLHQVEAVLTKSRVSFGALTQAVRALIRSPQTEEQAP